MSRPLAHGIRKKSDTTTTGRFGQSWWERGRGAGAEGSSYNKSTSARKGENEKREKGTKDTLTTAVEIRMLDGQRFETYKREREERSERT